MRENLTEMVFVLDRSGSMSGLAADTIGGFNELIEKQKKIEGCAYVTTVLFDHEYEVLHDHVALEEVAPLTDKEYFARGSTALLDAVGRTIDAVGARLAATAEEERPAHVVFVITTRASAAEVFLAVRFPRSKHGRRIRSAESRHLGKICGGFHPQSQRREKNVQYGAA